MNTDRPFAVLFDLDGTLIDSIPLLLECVHHAFEHFTGTPPTDEDWIAGIGTPLAKQMAAYCSDPAQIEGLTTRYRTYQRQHHDAKTAIYPGAIDVIKTLHAAGHPMGIVTSKSNAMLDRTLDFLGIREYMQTAIGADSCHLHKPDPFPVTLALSHLNTPPHHAAFVGDSPHDINAGNAAGVTTIAALWGPFSKPQLEPFSPTHFLQHLPDLPDLIQEIQSVKSGV